MFKTETRKKILERDKYTCQFDKLFGISELTGVPCSPQLEIHHRTYKREKENKERVGDGVTVCKRCHGYLLTNIIREKRYSKKKIKMKNINRAIPKLKTREVKNEKPKSKNYRRESPSYAQPGPGESAKRIYKSHKKDIGKKS